MTDQRRGILYVVVAALLWSTGGIGIKAVADSALKVTFYRSLFAAISLMLFLGRRVWGRRWTSTPAFAASVISYGACLTAFVVATKWTTAANAIFLQYAGLIWVLLFAPIVVREPMRARDVVAIVTALAGLCCSPRGAGGEGAATGARVGGPLPQPGVCGEWSSSSSAASRRAAWPAT